jgi:hypothetical protein
MIKKPSSGCNGRGTSENGQIYKENGKERSKTVGKTAISKRIKLGELRSNTTFQNCRANGYFKKGALFSRR